MELDLAALEVDDAEAGRVAAVQGAGVDEERGTSGAKLRTMRRDSKPMPLRVFLVHDDSSVDRIAVSRFERLTTRGDPNERGKSDDCGAGTCDAGYCRCLDVKQCTADTSAPRHCRAPLGSRQPSSATPLPTGGAAGTPLGDTFALETRSLRPFAILGMSPSTTIDAPWKLSPS